MRGRSTTGLAALALVVSTALAGCSGGDDAAPPAPPASEAGQEPVDVALGGDQDTVVPSIGVLLAVSTAPGQGQDVLAGAQGAQVAAYRLGLDGGTAPELSVELDDGTRAGARDAVRRLLDQGVGGIVVASTGSHLEAAVEAASDAGTPVLLPYWRTGQELGDGVWLTGPSPAAVDIRTIRALQRRDLAAPFVITADGVTPPNVAGDRGQEFRGNNPEGLADKLRAAARRDDIDSVVVAASASTQARIVSVLQGQVPDLPVVLTPEALSPVFAQQLVEDGGTAAGRFSTVGADAGDVTSLGSSERAEDVAAYFAALRLAAGDPEATDLLGEQPFAEVAEGADVASHDAVVTLARATWAAGDASPAAVTTALEGLSLDGSDGLAGPALDFGASTAMGADAVTELIGTTQDPGVRPTSTDDDAARLFWFALPAEGDGDAAAESSG